MGGGQGDDEASDPRGSFSAAYRLAQSDGAREQRPKQKTKTKLERGYYGEPDERRVERRVERGAADDDAGKEDEQAVVGVDHGGLRHRGPRDAVAVLPLGATEAHGPHLPLGVDSMHNAALLARALELVRPDVRVLALPRWTSA